MIRSLLLAATVMAATTSAYAECGPDALGTSRTLTLPREYAAYGTNQHAPLPGLQKGEVVLTFDDGPRQNSTQGVLKALDDQCVLATFFMVGNNISANPDLARQVVSAGHSAALHSLRHANLNDLTPQEQAADLKANQDAFTAALGFKAAAYRFPFLAEAPATMNLLQSEGLTVMSVDFGIADWDPNLTTDILVGRLVTELDKSGGGILLLHDGFDTTAAALPALLNTLKAKGYKVVHVVWQ